MNKWFLEDKNYLLWWLIGQARDTLYLVRSKEIREYGITPRQVSVLFTIKVLEDIEGKATLSKISEWLLNEPHTVSRIVSRMVKDGFLKKTRDKMGNELKISLTEKGEQTYQLAIKSDSLQDVMVEISEEDRQQLFVILKRLRDQALKKIDVKNIPFP